jgi:hypothetical protein
MAGCAFRLRREFGKPALQGSRIPGICGQEPKAIPLETQYDTIITTNLDFSEWAGLLGNAALVEALLSRLRHHCHTVRIEGPSLREPQG